MVWDISPFISPDTPTFPGDTAYSQRWVARIGPRLPVNVSAITMSPHVGAHADAPLHYGPDAAAIGGVSLDPFLGRCRVVHAIDRGALIKPGHLSHAVDDLPPRVLVRTCVSAPTRWSAALLGVRPGDDRLAGWSRRAAGRASIRRPSIQPTARHWTAISSCWPTTCACSRTWCSTTSSRATTS